MGGSTMPSIEVVTKPSEIFDSEIISTLNQCKIFYLKSIILKIVEDHPDLKDEIKACIKTTYDNQENDDINKLLSSANFPGYPEHYRLSVFDPSCLSEKDQKEYEELSKLGFLKNKKKPNVLLFGLPSCGREKVAIGLGDACCRAKKSVYYIPYATFVDTIRTRVKPASKKIYEKMQKSNCLIIDNFAGTRVYDEDILDCMTQFLEERAQAHTDSCIQHEHDASKPLVPRCTIVTSLFQPANWVGTMDQHEKKTFVLARLFYSSHATLLQVDETNTSSANNQPDS